MNDDEFVSTEDTEMSVLSPFIGNEATDEGAPVRLIRRPTDTPESGIPDTVHVLNMDAISRSSPVEWCNARVIDRAGVG